ncbi:hypothetical protein Anas_01550 [Armadillidium nasatum]|uniref:Uncharacterized protein n=1 Tax=Armadillidium nasatum TaxID=96803 RepID=A0A5N5TML7_9CRUS|nr:hypothetical protein Anas_01550 [Armadillidium nasatum]
MWSDETNARNLPLYDERKLEFVLPRLILSIVLFEIQLATGEWMNAFVRRPSRRKERFSSPVEGVKNVILRRSWSISSPSTSTWDVCEESKRKPPAKPPRKSLDSNDNVKSPPDSGTTNMPSKRYSMGSFDNLPGRRSLRGDAELCLNKHHREDISNPNIASKMEFAQCRNNKEPPKYFFGSNIIRNEPTRPSTLPRRPSRPKRPVSYGEFEDDPNKFNSIPRRIEPRSSSASRHHRSSSGTIEPHTSREYDDYNPVSKSKEYDASYRSEPLALLGHREFSSTSKRDQELYKERYEGFSESLPREPHKTSKRLKESPDTLSLNESQKVRQNESRLFDERKDHLFVPRESRSLSGYRESQRRDEPRSSGRSREPRSVSASQEISSSERQKEMLSQRRERDVSPYKEPRQIYSSKQYKESLYQSEPHLPRTSKGAPYSPQTNRREDLHEYDKLNNQISSKNLDNHSAQNKNMKTLNITSGPAITVMSSSVPDNISVPQFREENKMAQDFLMDSQTHKSFDTLLDIQRAKDERVRQLQQSKPKGNASLESSFSDISFQLSDDMRDDGDYNIHGQNRPSRAHIPRSNTSITSGFSSMGRVKRAASVPVRRAKSFQAGTSIRSGILEDNASPTRTSKSQVAKFINEFEKGIQETWNNMSPKKPGVGLKSSGSFRGSLPSNYRKTPVEKAASNVAREADDGDYYSDTEIEPSKLSTAEGNKYKIVFISSGSSKDSDPNSPSDSDTLLNWGDRNQGKKSRRLTHNKYPSSKNTVHERKFVDASIMTDDAKDTSSDESGEDTSSLIPQRPSSPEDESLFSLSEDPKTPNYIPQENSSRNTKPEMNGSLRPLNQSKLNIMLKQTEAVEAEAQALQKALMGAFEPKIIPQTKHDIPQN